MYNKPWRKLVLSVTSLLMTIILIAPYAASADEAAAAVTTTTTNSVLLKAAKDRVSVHDPSIVKNGDTYYVFGSHIEAAKSTDLKNWTRFTNGYTTPGNTLYGDLSKNLAGSFAWAGENDSDSKGGFSVWAPDVFWNKDYVNADGSVGAYMIYYSASSTYIRSAIGFAVSKNIEGPYTYGDTVVYSGFTKEEAYDTNSVINKKYTNTNIQSLIDAGKLAGPRSGWFNSNGSYNNGTFPNAIDSTLVYDKDGKLWMVYGSWSGGIFMLEIDKATGKAIYPGSDGTTADGRLIDRYFGTKVAGGYGKSGEGPYIVYDAQSGYYYLYVTYGGLNATGGYNMRLFRSTNVTGPYVDASGKNAVLPSNTSNEPYGIKLIGNYKFSSSPGYRAGGHNSSFIDSNGQMYLVYHTRFDNAGEYHEVRVHQMFKNEDGWPVTAPYEYNGDVISQTGYTKDEIVGTYEFINHGTSNTGTNMLPTSTIQLNADNTVTGGATGTWSMTDGTYYMQAVIGGVTYKGVFFKQQDESNFDSAVMTFSAIGSNNQSIWGSRNVADDKAVQFDAYTLDESVPASVTSSITLPAAGANNTAITWTSSNKYLLSPAGVVNRLNRDETVTLTARIAKGSFAAVKSYSVVVKGNSEGFNVTPIYQYKFDSADAASEVANSGSKSGNAKLIGTASIASDAEHGSVLQIKNTSGAVKANYLALPTDTFDGITSAGYTVSMWVNADQSDSNYFEHSALFEANGGGQDKYPVTRMSANLWSRINANGAWADALSISNGLTSNHWHYVTYTVNPSGIVVYLDGIKVGSAEKDLALSFANNALAGMTDVRVGSGNIWGDRDLASAKFDNVAVFNTALSGAQVDALYRLENPAAATDKSGLIEALTSASSYLAQADEEDQAALEAAIAAGETVLNNARATQAEIDAAVAALQEAIAAAIRNTLTLTGPAVVGSGQAFDVTVGLLGVDEDALAQDITVRYDADRLEWAGADETLLNDSYKLVGQEEEAGSVRLLFVKLGTGDSDVNGGLIKLHFRVKTDRPAGAASIALTEASMANGQGVETPLTGAALQIQIHEVDKTALHTIISQAEAVYDGTAAGTGIGQVAEAAKTAFGAAITAAKAVAASTSATEAQVAQAVSDLTAALTVFQDAVIEPQAGDVNEDQRVSIGDLAIIAAGYGKTNTDPEWTKYAKADINHDGKIDIEDLAAMARLILS